MQGASGVALTLWAPSRRTPLWRCQHSGGLDLACPLGRVSPALYDARSATSALGYLGRCPRSLSRCHPLPARAVSFGRYSSGRFQPPPYRRSAYSSGCVLCDTYVPPPVRSTGRCSRRHLSLLPPSQLYDFTCHPHSDASHPCRRQSRLLVHDRRRGGAAARVGRVAGCG